MLAVAHEPLWNIFVGSSRPSCVETRGTVLEFKGINVPYIKQRVSSLSSLKIFYDVKIEPDKFEGNE